MQEHVITHNMPKNKLLTQLLSHSGQHRLALLPADSQVQETQMAPTKLGKKAGAVEDVQSSAIGVGQHHMQLGWRLEQQITEHLDAGGIDEAGGSQIEHHTCHAAIAAALSAKHAQLFQQSPEQWQSTFRGGSTEGIHI